VTLYTQRPAGAVGRSTSAVSSEGNIPRGLIERFLDYFMLATQRIRPNRERKRGPRARQSWVPAEAGHPGGAAPLLIRLVLDRLVVDQLARHRRCAPHRPSGPLRSHRNIDVRRDVTDSQAPRTVERRQMKSVADALPVDPRRRANHRRPSASPADHEAAIGGCDQLAGRSDQRARKRVRHDPDAVIGPFERCVEFRVPVETASEERARKIDASFQNIGLS